MFTNRAWGVGLKTTGIYHRRVVDTRSPKSGCRQGCAPPGGSREKPSFLLSISGGPSVVLGLRQHHSNLCLHRHVAFFPVRFQPCVFSLRKGCQWLDVSPALNQDDFICVHTETEGASRRWRLVENLGSRPG